MDVTSLYPSIPQTECLNILYEEINTNRDLMLFDPNLVIKLLHASITNNFFQFGSFTFQQIKGTAMGVTFSPAIANIFMSVLIRTFLSTQGTLPFLLKRYIDNKFLIWTDTAEELEKFIRNVTRQYNLHTSSQIHQSIFWISHYSKV